MCKTHYSDEVDVTHWWKHDPSPQELSHHPAMFAPNSETILLGRLIFALNTSKLVALVLVDEKRIPWT